MHLYIQYKLYTVSYVLLPVAFIIPITSLLHTSTRANLPVSTVTAECVQGVLPQEAVDVYGPSSKSSELPSTSRGILYVLPSMNFSCSGTITDIRMRMDFIMGQPATISQAVVVYFLLFHDGLNSPTRRVSYILLNHNNTEQQFDGSRQKFTEIWQNLNPLSLSVTRETFIGLAVPENRHPAILNKNIDLSPTSERVEAHIYKVTADFSAFEGEVLEAARTVDSSQFTPQMIAPPLIDVSFSKWFNHHPSHNAIHTHNVLNRHTMY